MSAAEALNAAYAAGISVCVDGNDLALEASAPPPTAVLDLLARHKADVVSLLRPVEDGWLAKDYRAAFEERAAIVEFEAGVPRHWAEGYARLLGEPVPTGVEPDRWQTFLDDCGWFLDRWAVEAAALGWQAHDLFGLAETKPEARVDLAGLCWLLNGRELVVLTERTAAIKCPSGAIQHFRRIGSRPRQRLAWEPQR